jgi:hypothetical protein
VPPISHVEQLRNRETETDRASVRPLSVEDEMAARAARVVAITRKVMTRDRALLDELSKR